MRFASFSFAREILLAALALPAAVAVVAVDAVPARAGSPREWSVTSARSLRPPAGIRVVESSRDEPPGRTLDLLEEAGYHVDVAVLPGTFFVRPRANARSLPDGMSEVAPVDPLEEGNRAAAAGGAASAATSVPPPSAPSDPFGGRADAFPPRGRAPAPAARAAPMRGETSTSLFYGTRWGDTSEFMIGRVAVPLLFVESDGSFDPNRYDWTPALRDSVIRSAVRGLLKWTGLASARGIPLTFLLEIHPVLPTRYEPIERPVREEHLWIEDALQPLVGYTGDPFEMAYDVANAARARLGTQWAALLFAVQNDTDPDGLFSDKIGEHAQLGGPHFVVLLRPTNSIGGATLDYYIEHEMTHMFWALDEHFGLNPWWACTLASGYFNQQNSNSMIPTANYCGMDLRCLMKGNYPDSLCPATARQIGWVDLDGTGVLDFYETRPAVLPDSTHYHRTPGTPLTIQGTVADVALPNRNSFDVESPDSITVAVIDSTWYRVDGGSWVPIPPGDGTYDQGSERFQFVLASPGAGNHLLEFQALNSNGLRMASPASVPVTISGASSPLPGDAPGPAVARVDLGPTPTSGRVRFALRAVGGARAAVRLIDVSGRVVRTWPLELPAAGRVEWEWDGSTGRGAKAAGGIYFVVVQIGAERLTRRLVVLR